MGPHPPALTWTGSLLYIWVLCNLWGIFYILWGIFYIIIIYARVSKICRFQNRVIWAGSHPLTQFKNGFVLYCTGRLDRHTSTSLPLQLMLQFYRYWYYNISVQWEMPHPCIWPPVKAEMFSIPPHHVYLIHL